MTKQLQQDQEKGVLMYPPQRHGVHRVRGRDRCCEFGVSVVFFLRDLCVSVVNNL